MVTMTPKTVTVVLSIIQKYREACGIVSLILCNDDSPTECQKQEDSPLYCVSLKAVETAAAGIIIWLSTRLLLQIYKLLLKFLRRLICCVPTRGPDEETADLISEDGSNNQSTASMQFYFYMKENEKPPSPNINGEGPLNKHRALDYLNG